MESSGDKHDAKGQTRYIIELTIASSTAVFRPNKAASVKKPTIKYRSGNESKSSLKYKLEAKRVGANVVRN